MHNDPLTGFASLALSSQQTRDAALLRASTELFTQESKADHDQIRRFEDLAIHLIPRVPVAERRFVAERLATRIDAPPAVIRLLAGDTIDVARPVLLGSPVLAANDLLAIIARTGPEHRALIAERQHLPDDVARASGRGAPPDDVAADTPVVANAPDAVAAPSARSPGRARADARLDPWVFLGLDRAERLALMRDIATHPPAQRTPQSMNRLDRAFRSILGAVQIVGHARSGQRDSLVTTLAATLGLSPAFVTASLDDDSGEPLAVLLKAIALDNIQAQLVFLLSTRKIGYDTTAFLRICDLFAGMEPVVAEAFVEAWRDGAITPPRYMPAFGDRDDRVRPSAPDSVRDRKVAAEPAPRRLER